ncbi:GNAT family N-acetyltransferase, partial [Saccharothrix sp. MB29]|nr:GNAT family N-acetyltransferase [Saccharothrix sp. MB29]
MRELPTPADVAAANPDRLVRWAAQALLPGHWRGGGAAWAHGDAVAVLAPGLNRRDRLVAAGPVDDVAVLLRAHERPGVTPLVTEELAVELDRPDRIVFGWMERGGRLPDGPISSRGAPEWLGEDEWDAVESLLRKASPHSYVWPHEPGPSRWAGIRVDGVLAAVAADAWSAPGVGFLAGVATHPDHRGRSLSTAVCAFVARDLLAEHGGCALMVNADNPAAIAVYRRLGFAYRSVAALPGPDGAVGDATAPGPSRRAAGVPGAADFSRLLHAYGVASDTPAHLAALTGDDPAARARAARHLRSAVVHQSTVWSVTPHALPAVLAALSDPRAADVRADLLDFLDEVLDGCRPDRRAEFESLARPGRDVDGEVAAL